MAKKSKITSVKESKTPIYISFGFLIVVVAVYFFSPGFRGFLQEAWNVLSSGDEQRIENWVSQFGLLGPLVLVVTKVFQLFMVIIPTIVMVAVAVLAYGSFWGGAIAFIAVFAAASIAYFLGAYFGPAILEKLVGGKSQELITGMVEDYGIWAVGMIRANPLFSGDAISFVAGVLKMNYWRFIGATMTGVIPLILFIALIGRDSEALVNGFIWGSVVGIVALLFYIWYDRKKGKRRTEED